MRPVHRSAAKPFAGPGTRLGYGWEGRQNTVRATPRCSRTGYCRFVHRHALSSLRRNPEVKPEEADYAAAAAATVVMGQLPTFDCWEVRLRYWPVVIMVLVTLVVRTAREIERQRSLFLELLKL